LAAVGIVASLIVALTACSSGDRVDLGDGSSGNLVAAIAGEPDQLDPQKTSAYFSFEVLENVFDTLVQPDANLEMRPALAESWTVSPDQPAWTFHLRRGVTFHEGSPITADDVVYSYRRIIDQSWPTPTSSAPSAVSLRPTRRRSSSPSNSRHRTCSPTSAGSRGWRSSSDATSRAERSQRIPSEPDPSHSRVVEVVFAWPGLGRLV
jgi:ABC-type transport system substrate-binding protein